MKLFVDIYTVLTVKKRVYDTLVLFYGVRVMSKRQNLKTILMSGACSLFLFSGTNVRAETLEEALAYTYVANPALTAQRSYTRSVYEKIIQNRSGYLPVLSAGAQAGYAYNDVDTGEILTTYETDSKPYGFNVSAVQPIFSGFSTVASVKTAESLFKTEMLNLRSAEQGVLLDAVSAYTAVIRDTAVLKLNQNNEAVLARQLEYTRDKFRVGELTKTDVAQAEARYAGAIAARINAEGELKVSYASYEKTIGKVPESIYEPEIPTSVLPQTLESALELAQNNPSLLAAQQNERRAQSALDVAKSGHYPNLDLVAQYEDGHADDLKEKEASVMLVLNVPLYQGGNVAAKVRESKHLAGQARLNVDTVRRDIVRQTTQAWENYASASASLSSLEEQVRAAALALEGVKYEEEAGTRTILDVLNAEQELLDAKVEVVSAKKKQIEASYALLAATGKMTPKDLGLDLSKYQKRSKTTPQENKIERAQEKNNKVN